MAAVTTCFFDVLKLKKNKERKKKPRDSIYLNLIELFGFTAELSPPLGRRRPLEESCVGRVALWIIV